MRGRQFGLHFGDASMADVLIKGTLDNAPVFRISGYALTPAKTSDVNVVMALLLVGSLWPILIA